MFSVPGSQIVVTTQRGDDVATYWRLLLSEREKEESRLANCRVISGEVERKIAENRRRILHSFDELRFRALNLPKEILIAPPPRYYQMTAEDTGKAESAINGGGEMGCLAQNNWLNDEVINAYMTLLNERSEKAQVTQLERILHTRPLKIHAWNTFFWGTLNGTTSSLTYGEYDYSKVARWTRRKKVDIFQLDLMLFPLHIQKIHWALGCVDFRTRLVFYFDSLGETPPSGYFESVVRYLNDEHNDKKGTQLPDMEKWLYGGNNFSCSVLCPPNILAWLGRACHKAPVPLQKNGSDCGVFMCYYAENLSLSIFPFDFDGFQTNTLRLIMARDILRGYCDNPPRI